MTDKFLSTPSARRATLSNRLWLGRLFISIHALREEGDPLQSPPCALLSNFYPRPPRGGRLLTQQEITQINDFYPRPPRGGRRARWNPLVLIPVFLSTPSARRATAIDVSGQIGRQISIHALREEGDLDCSTLEQMLLRFLSTPSARRATDFDPDAAKEEIISIHALREEGDGQQRHGRHDPDAISIHALREEGDSVRTEIKEVQTIFLSTPSARRATGRWTGRPGGWKISIHALREEGDSLEPVSST